MENRNRVETDEMEIDLGEILLLLVNKLPLMIAVGLCVAMLAFLGSKFVLSPVYESTTKIYILNKQDNTSVTYADLQMGTQLTKDYAEMIKSRFVLEAVIEQLGLEEDYEDLSKMVSVTTPTDTRVLSITVSDKSPVRAMRIANAVREASADHIGNVMDIEAVNVVETANVPTHKASPHTGKNTLLGGILGMFLVAAIVVIAHLLNDTVRTAEDVERYLGLPTLAVIPMNEAEAKKKKKRGVKRHR